MKTGSLLCALGAAATIGCAIAKPAHAQVPPDIAEGLRKIGQVVDPAWTAKLYRPLMPANDYNTYMSEVFSIDTADRIVSDPILAWIRKVKSI